MLQGDRQVLWRKIKQRKGWECLRGSQWGLRMWGLRKDWRLERLESCRHVWGGGGRGWSRQKEPAHKLWGCSQPVILKKGGEGCAAGGKLWKWSRGEERQAVTDASLIIKHCTYMKRGRFVFPQLVALKKKKSSVDLFHIFTVTPHLNFEPIKFRSRPSKRFTLLAHQCHLVAKICNDHIFWPRSWPWGRGREQGSTFCQNNTKCEKLSDTPTGKWKSSWDKLNLSFLMSRLNQEI